MKFSAFLLALLSVMALSAAPAEAKALDQASMPVTSSLVTDKDDGMSPGDPAPSEECSLDGCNIGLGKVVTVPGGG